VRKETNDRSPFLELRLELRDQSEGFGVGVIEIEDDQRRSFITVLFQLVGEVFFGFDELDFHVHLAGGFLNLGQKEQVIDEGKDSYTYDFRAYNENGDYVNAYLSYEGKTATVYMEKAVKD
jgi:hypothetical protein